MMVLGHRSRQRLSRMGGAIPDDFEAAITMDPLVVADHADDAPKWLPIGWRLSRLAGESLVSH